jgi:hypothetical protein
LIWRNEAGEALRQGGFFRGEPVMTPRPDFAPLPAGLDPLGAYAGWLAAWRMTFLDMPLAFAAAFDGLVPRGLERGSAHWTRLSRCTSVEEVMGEQVRFTQEALAEGRAEVEALARDVAVTLETGAAG